MGDVKLKVNGIEYGGWTSVRISHSMEAIAGSFELGVTDRWSGQSIDRPIKKGDACQVLIDGQVVITGYVDDRQVSYNKESHTITIAGRDRTGDLVDSQLAPATYKGQTLTRVAEAVCKPFGITVIAEADVGKPFDEWEVETNETAHETLSRAAAHRGVLLLSDGLGKLVIGKASTASAPSSLVFGKNIEACSSTSSQRDQFRDYIVRNQVSGSEGFNGSPATEAKATSRDASVKRYRPMNMQAEYGADLQQRADHERNVRAGQANRFTYTVSSWLADGKSLWQMNRLLPVTDPHQEPRLNSTRLLIAGITFFRDENGTGCELTLMARGAFDVLARPEDAKDSGELEW